MTGEPIRTSVAIIGAGPVGMTLALDLAGRGIDVAVIEQRPADAPPRQRCNHLAARTLEIFRRLGVAAEIREAGLPPDYPHDVAYVTTLTGHELSRIRIPSRSNRFGTSGYADSDWPTAEPPHRCNQMYWEPIMQRHVRGSPRIQLFLDTQVEEVSQDEQGVTARARDGSTGEERLFRADYLVGCDGGSSLVRKAIGAAFEGTPVISGTRSVLVRSPELLSRLKVDPAWMTWFVNPDAFGCMVAMNGEDLWGFHIWLPPGEPDFDSADPATQIRGAFGGELDYEILSIDDWYGRRLVANRFRDRRMLICGDSAHIWIPFAGYGMNAGIADAATLGWQVAAAVQGWAGPALLDAYEAERQPVTQQVSRHVMAIAFDNLDMSFIRNPPAQLMEEGTEADALRERAGKAMYDANVGQFACLGLNFGTFFEDSPIIAYDGEAAPEYDLSTYHPSTVPGCRTPHLWLADGSSLYDRLGEGYTLLRTDPSVDVAPFLEAAAARGVPLDLLDLTEAEAVGLYDRKLVLSRPDQMIAWRGDALPEEALALIDQVRGA